MADDLQQYFQNLPYKLKRELAEGLKDIADRLASDIKQATPVKTGKLRDSVRVRRGRNTLELYVEAGGVDTTKMVREGSGVDYDYALGVEFGNLHAPAQPFFYNTYRAREADIREEISDLLQDVLDKA